MGLLMETTSLQREQHLLDSVPVNQLLNLLLNTKLNQIQNPDQKEKATFIRKQARELSINCSGYFHSTSSSQDHLL